MRISQNGNTANNGFHNAVLLADAPDISVIGKPSVASIRHAFSQPAWDLFPQLDIGGLANPLWNHEATEINTQFCSYEAYPRSLFKASRFDLTASDYQDIIDRLGSAIPYSLPNLQPISSVQNFEAPTFVQSKAIDLARRTFGQFNRYLRKTRTIKSELHPGVELGDIHITFGNATPHLSPRRQRDTTSVVVEHGQVRWIADGPSSAERQRKDFFSLCANADHIWVTNVDERTLGLADEYFPGRWSTLPHPYVLDSNTPYSESQRDRALLCEEVESDFLLLNASSLSIGGDQQKGTEKLLHALADLRVKDHIRVGAFFVNWGQDVLRACKMMCELDIADQCRLVDPMPRVALQRFMANFDIVSDQFDYDAFGALTIRTLEQGMPLLSRPVGNRGAESMGGRPPVIGASNAEEIRRQLLNCREEQQRMGRSAYISRYRIVGRNWIYQRHHHSLTQVLQTERYRQLKSAKRPPASVFAWGDLPSARSNP